MSDSPDSTVGTEAQDESTPKKAQGPANQASPYVPHAMSNSPAFYSPESFNPYFPPAYFPQSPFAVPFVYQYPLMGQPFDLRTLYGPLMQYPLTRNLFAQGGLYPGNLPANDVAFLYGSAFGNGQNVPSDGEKYVSGDAPGVVSGIYAPSSIQSNEPSISSNVGQGVPAPAAPLQTAQTMQASQPNQPSQPMQPVQQSQSFDPALATQPASQSTSSTPSVQVVVQPSQPLPPVQAQKTTSNSQAVTQPVMQSSMPTNVMQPVPSMGQLYGSGMMYPPQSSPFFADDYVNYDIGVASGGRAAGATFLGILSIPFSLFAPLGFLFSLVGLHLANSYANNGGSRAVGNFARFFNVIGLILTVVFTAAVALYVGYSAGQEGFLIFGYDPISYINNSEFMHFLFEQWSRLKELIPF